MTIGKDIHGNDIKEGDLVVEWALPWIGAREIDVAILQPAAYNPRLHVFDRDLSRFKLVKDLGFPVDLEVGNFICVFPLHGKQITLYRAAKLVGTSYSALRFRLINDWRSTLEWLSKQIPATAV